ncbi:MAG: ATP-binding protein [Flavobacteriia bacterium]|jgi:serine/threonine-protein kinase RsbW|nr:ATP-binding protein [Flavobacteriia bacterium]
MKEGFSIVTEVVLPSDYQSLIDVEKLVGGVCEEFGVQEDAFGNVLIAVSEAVNNAIQHGNKDIPNAHVELKVANQDDLFCIQVKDQGKGFSYQDLPDPTAPENLLKDSGRGVFLMKNLADEVEFLNTGSTVNLYFHK